MDKLKIGTKNLAAAAIGILGSTLSLGCATASIPTRHTPCAVLVRSGELDRGAFATRNDARLGQDRDPVIRETILSTRYAVDRQRVINGQPYVDFRVTTRTADRAHP